MLFSIYNAYILAVFSVPFGLSVENLKNRGHHFNVSNRNPLFCVENSTLSIQFYVKYKSSANSENSFKLSLWYLICVYLLASEALQRQKSSNKIHTGKFVPWTSHA